jgi:hypothetical protein
LAERLLGFNIIEDAQNPDLLAVNVQRQPYKPINRVI